VHDTLDQAIGAAPVSSVDVDTVVARGRRRGFRRRLAVTGAAGGTACVAVGIVIALVLTSASPPTAGRTQNQAQPGASLTTGPVHDGTAPGHDGETQQQTQRRLADALTSGLTAALPGVRLSNGPTGRPGVVVGGYDNSRYDSDIVLTTAAGTSEVGFVSSPGGGPTLSPAQGAMPRVILWLESCAALPSAKIFSGEGYRIIDSCQQSTGPAGQTVVVVTERCTGCPHKYTIYYDVYVTWRNAWVNLIVNRDTKRGGPDDSLTAPVLSADQLVAIAINPDLTVTS
jgi:hypothetical protein